MPNAGVAVTVAITGARFAGVVVGGGDGEVGGAESSPPLHAANTANRHRGSRRRIVESFRTGWTEAIEPSRSSGRIERPLDTTIEPPLSHTLDSRRHRTHPLGRPR